jgi:hypothetical protein
VLADAHASEVAAKLNAPTGFRGLLSRASLGSMPLAGSPPARVTSNPITTTTTSSSTIATNSNNHNYNNNNNNSGSGGSGAAPNTERQAGGGAATARTRRPATPAVQEQDEGPTTGPNPRCGCVIC